MAFHIIIIPAGDSLPLVCRVLRDEFCQVLSDVGTGRTFIFAAKSDPALPDDQAEIYKTTGITTVGREVRVHISPDELTDLTNAQNLYWVLKSNLTAGGIVRTLCGGLLARGVSVLQSFPNDSVQISDEAGVLITAEDGTQIVTG